MPATPEATRELLEQIGPIRNTHYGIYHWNRCIMTNRPVLTTRKGGFYDFTSDLSSKDTAYTSESLEPHTDTTYFTEPIVSRPDRYSQTMSLQDIVLTAFLPRVSKRSIFSPTQTAKADCRLSSMASALLTRYGKRISRHTRTSVSPRSLLMRAATKASVYSLPRRSPS